jgi:hypothetical protein
MKFVRWMLLGISIVLLFSFLLPTTLNNLNNNPKTSMNLTSTLLTDPFLQLPTETSVRVVWFTEFLGAEHKVLYGDALDRQSIANSIKLSRMSEDRESQTSQTYEQLTSRDIWRHEAIVEGLTPGKSVPYKVISQRKNGDRVEQIESKVFNLAAKPEPETPLKILLTSDHQLMPMTAANLQKVGETIGKIDAVFVAGDLINIPDRASEWFDDRRSGAFFPCLQGRASYALEKEGTKTVYKGAELIQNAPLFTAIGNHEVMGRFNLAKKLKQQFEDAHPIAQAEKKYRELQEQVNPRNNPQIKADWIRDNSFNTITYEEIFTLPESDVGGKQYYAVTFGDVRLVVLYVTSLWRSPNLTPDTKGRYRESAQDLNNRDNWGYGQVVFGDITKESPQYRWLEKELNSEEFKQAKYKMVMFHHPPHTLGDNIVPPYTQPIPKIQTLADGTVESVFYEYPIANDYIIRDLEPLLESAAVNLVFYGHSHLWNRFVSPQGMNFLETSNVGNSYGAYLGDKKRPVPTGEINLERSNYKEVGDPNGLAAILPTISPLANEKGQPQAYIASNDITAFSILDTGTGKISSYRFDTRKPNSEVIKFDEFDI